MPRSRHEGNEDETTALCDTMKLSSSTAAVYFLLQVIERSQHKCGVEGFIFITAKVCRIGNMEPSELFRDA